MKKLFCLLLIFTMAGYAFAQKVTVDGYAPTVTGGVNADQLNRDIQDAFDEVLNRLKDVKTLKDDIPFANPQQLLQSMGNSSAYASHGATTRAYGDYKIFSAAIGAIFGFELPTGITSIKDDIEGRENSMTKEGDVKLGLSPNLINAHIGLNMGIFKIDNLYLGLRIGYFNLPSGIINNFDYNSFTLGVTANYQLLPSLSLAGFIKWRGVSLGSGILYSSSKISLTQPFDIKEPITNDQGYISMSPKTTLALDVTTVTIPLEAITSIKLLIFNIPFGIGADLVFGSTSYDLKTKSDIQVNLNSTGYSATPGDISVKIVADNSPSFFNFKIMTGLGITAGPAIFDIPFTYYPGSGYNFGLTIGAVF